MKVWKRVMEMLFGLNELLCSSQASLIALFTHTTHADNVSSSLQSENVHAWHVVVLVCSLD